MAPCGRLGGAFLAAREGMRARLFAASILSCFLVAALSAEAQDARALHARHDALRAQLADNPFGRALHVESSETSGEQQGAIYAVVEQPFKRVLAGLRHAAQWCEVLIVQANVKNCEASNRTGEALAI